MVDVAGIVVLSAFYLLVLAVGIVAARWFKRQNEGSSQTEVALVAGRKLGGFVGIFTMTATTVGGGYINGTAESVARDGLVWTLAPFGIFMGLIIGGVVYARRMREAGYLTMFDPFQHRYGNVVVILLYIAAMAADVFWSASILVALGTSLSVILGVPQMVSILISALVAVLYTVFGQMVAVAYTDIIQLIFITLGLVLCVPFAMTHSAVTSIATTEANWLGTLHWRLSVGVWADLLVAMTFGTIPWQTYFQRVLSVKSARQAQLLSVAGAFGALLLAVPPVLIGAVAVSTNWTDTAYQVSPLDRGQSSLVLPLVVYYLTPNAVGILGLGAIAAAVMSSLDSAILASASLFSHNIWGAIFRQRASSRELMWVQRIAVLAITAIATSIALFVESIYGMFIMAADLVFVIMFPQLTAVIFLPWTNTYGALTGYILGVVLRLGAGESYIYLKPFIHYPFYSNLTGQLFPFRTFAMMWSFASILIVSRFTNFIFEHNIVPRQLDFLKCFPQNETTDLHQRQREYAPVSVISQNGNVPHAGEIRTNNGHITNTESREELGGEETRSEELRRRAGGDAYEMQELKGPVANGHVGETSEL